jgi:tRNA dimethylallyltransferase
MDTTMKPHLLVILGPTASGKSSCAVGLAQHFDGEVISADSRQVYRGLNIGTGKITPDETRGIPHHLLNVVGPTESFSVADFKRLADKTIRDVTERNRLPILAGGTGFYIQSIVDSVVPPEVPADEKRRRELEQKDTVELFALLTNLDPRRAATIEHDNPRRLIRAIEIAETLGHVPHMNLTFPTNYDKSIYAILQIGLRVPEETLKEQIRLRVTKRLENGWQDEVRELMAHGVSTEKLREFGLGYAILAEQLHTDATEAVTSAEWQYAKRQLRWFKRDPRIVWVSYDDQKQIAKLVSAFLS